MHIFTAKLNITILNTQHDNRFIYTGDAVVHQYTLHAYIHWDMRAQHPQILSGHLTIEQDIITLQQIEDKIAQSIQKQTKILFPESITTLRAITWEQQNDHAYFIKHLLLLLEHARKRPGMYFYPKESRDALINWLSGLYAGFSFVGLTPDYRPKSAYGQVLQQRGWEYDTGYATRSMQKKGLTDAAIIHELLTIEIETWRSRFPQ